MNGCTDHSILLSFLCVLLSTRHHHTVGIDLVRLFSRVSLQKIIEIGLQARDTVSFGIDGAHDRTGCIAIGIGSIKDRFPFDTGNVELADFTIGDRIDILFQIDVGRIPSIMPPSSAWLMPRRDESCFAASAGPRPTTLPLSSLCS